MRLPNLPYARLAGLGGLGIAAVLAAILALIIVASRPSFNTGLDTTQAVILWIAVGGIFLVLIAIHVVYARILLRQANGAGPRPP